MLRGDASNMKSKHNLKWSTGEAQGILEYGKKLGRKEHKLLICPEDLERLKNDKNRFAKLAKLQKKREEKIKKDRKYMKWLPNEIERCENCKKRITNKMKDAQHVIYASAEHTLYAADSHLAFGDRDEMFSGVFCCQNCYNEVSGINISYKKGFDDGKKDREKVFQEMLHWKDLAINLQSELEPYRKKELKRIEKIKVRI